MLPAIEYQLAPSPTLPDQPDWQQLAAEYPWYPLAQWQAARLGHTEAANRLFAFVQHPLRCQVLLSPATDTAAVSEKPAIYTAYEPAAAEQAATAAHSPSTEPALVDIDSKATEALQPAEEAIEETAVAAAAEDKSAEPALADNLLPTTAASIGNAVDDDDALLFQPYHTVDYFASLGIKIDPSLLSNSQFDRQLKSFTQWLKGMKRMNYQTGQFTDDPLVTRHATESLQKDPVITAAMAEVLARQGLKAEAISLYRKLSLLHPEKSAFFASQIEKLTQ